VAMFAGTTSVFGQALHNSYPRDLSCEDDALHPIAGKSYIYNVEVTPTPVGGTYQWWATKDQNFVETLTGVTSFNVDDSLSVADPGELLSHSSNYGQVTETSTVEIAWSSELLANTAYQGNPAPGTPTFVAVHYVAGSEGCSDNFKVYELNPINGFTVDIKNIADENLADTLAYDALESQCVDVVRGAAYNAGEIDYDYGTDTLYFEVIAANFSTSWTPTFKIDGLVEGQTASIEWDYSTAFSSPVLVTAAATSTDNGTLLTGTEFTSPSAALTSVTNTSIGVSIYVRVVVSNNYYETLTSSNISISVDGENSVGDLDVNNNGATDDCSVAIADFVDAATQEVTPRPDVTHNTPLNTATPPQDLIPNSGN